MATGGVPRVGVRRGVLPLRVLLPGAGVLRGGLPRAREAVIQQSRSPEGVRRVTHMVRVRDYDAAENRWMVEDVWPAPAKRASRAKKAPARQRTATPARAAGNT